jgi:hypothetical protein
MILLAATIGTVADIQDATRQLLRGVRLASSMGETSAAELAWVEVEGWILDVSD